MRLIPAILAVALASSSALAQRGDQYEDGRGNRLRVGAGCSLYLYGQKVSGTCDVLRYSRSPNTFVEVGNSVYVIEREPGNKYRGTFSLVTPRGRPNTFISSVEASGRCWVGEGVRFCAD